MTVEAESLPKGFSFPSLSKNSLTVLERRYLRKDENGSVTESPEKMLVRVAENIAQADLLYPENDVKKTEQEFLELFTTLEFLPNSPTLMNAGRELQQLSACFVLPVDDSMESIFDAIKNTALIHKSGGGTGFSFSRLRPKNDVVRSTKGISSGPISFMSVFDAATETIKQGGTRRGANMAILRIDHPDIVDFVTSKRDKSKLNNFNISVGLTEEFMRAVEKDETYALANPRTKKMEKKLPAHQVFDLIVDMAWTSGEPGIIFLDRINKDNPTPALGEIESTNPCGEQPLLPYESCNLGSINLSKMLLKTADGYAIDFEKLKNTVWKAIHLLDNVIDMNKYPLLEIENMTKGNRKIGLGVMGFADMLIMLGIPYDSDEAVEKAEELMSFIQKEARDASENLAETRGVFPNWEKSVFHEKKKLRNATVTTIAPTGSLSIIANCSSGIEPLFAISYKRTVLDKTELLEVHPMFEEIARREGFYSEELMRKITEKGTIKDMEEVPPHVRRIFVTSHDISPTWHVKIQAAFQRFTDNAVSKTVNFSQSATRGDIEKAYMLAYKLGCKGVTVYRDGSRDEQVLSFGKKEREDAKPIRVPRHRPEVTRGITQKMATGCGNLYVTINEDENGLCEVFATMGKSGGCAAAHIEAAGRLASLALRAGVETDSIIKQLKGIRCPKPMFSQSSSILSCPDAVGKAIENYIKKQSQTVQLSLNGDKYSGANINGHSPECPECGGIVEFKEGCVICNTCGYTLCS